MLDIAQQDIQTTLHFATTLQTAIKKIYSTMRTSDIVDDSLETAIQELAVATIHAQTVAEELSLCCREENQVAMKAHQAVTALEGSASGSSIEKKAALKILKDAADPCRAATAARNNASITHAMKVVQHMAKPVIEMLQKTRNELYRAGTTNKDLDTIQEAETIYQQALSHSPPIKRAPLNIEPP